MSYPDVIEALVLYMKELDNSSKLSIRRSIIRTQHSDDREKKFAIKTTLYEYFWKIEMHEECNKDNTNIYMM